MEQTYTYTINRGVGNTIEFKGLKAQYLVMFFGGVIAILLVTFILGAANAGFVVVILFVGGSASALVYYVFKFNKKYGEHGLMKKNAFDSLPKRMVRMNTYPSILQAMEKQSKLKKAA